MAATKRLPIVPDLDDRQQVDFHDDDSNPDDDEGAF